MFGTEVMRQVQGCMVSLVAHQPLTIGLGLTLYPTIEALLTRCCGQDASKMHITASLSAIRPFIPLPNHVYVYIIFYM